MPEPSESEHTNPYGDPTDVVNRFYIAEYDVSALTAQYEEARREFVEDTAEFFEQNIPGTESIGNEMMAEELLDEVFGDLIEHIEDKGISLWVTLDGDDEKGMDFPIYQRSPVGAFNSMQPALHQTDAREPSEEFFEAVALMVEDNEEEGGSGWGGAPDDLFESLDETEQEIFFRIRNILIDGSITPEVGLLIEYAKSR